MDGRIIDLFVGGVPAYQWFSNKVVNFNHPLFEEMVGGMSYEEIQKEGGGGCTDTMAAYAIAVKKGLLNPDDKLPHFDWTDGDEPVRFCGTPVKEVILFLLCRDLRQIGRASVTDDGAIVSDLGCRYFVDEEESSEKRERHWRNLLALNCRIYHAEFESLVDGAWRTSQGFFWNGFPVEVDIKQNESILVSIKGLWCMI